MRKRILSGMRPTGRLHLGNYHGALENFVRLQDEYECFFMIADWHALTTNYENTSSIREHTRELAIDFLSAGLDPERCTIFVQSDVKEHAELHLLFSMIVPLGWLERVPTYKEQLRQLEGRQIANYGFLGYPVLQSADIAVYRAEAVPVGEDQIPHLELTREIVRRFNSLYKPVFPEPVPLLTKASLLPGVDNRKMSKSYGNSILMADEPKVVSEKVRAMVTDPGRIRKNDPGNPEICTVYAFHKVYSPEEQTEIAAACRAGTIGCVECKRRLADKLEQYWAPKREKRMELEKRPHLVDEVLAEGAKKARAAAKETLELTREAIGL